MRDGVGVTVGAFIWDAVGVDVGATVGSFFGTLVGFSLIRRLSFGWRCTWILRRRKILLNVWSERREMELVLLTVGVFLGDAIGIDFGTTLGSFVRTAVSFSLIRRLIFSWHCTSILRRRKTLLKVWSDRKL